MRPLPRRLALAAAAVLLLAATLLAQDAARAQRRRFAAEDDTLYLPRPSALKVMALGHHELAADLVFVRAIIYFGGQFYGKRDYAWLENYLGTIVSLDPTWRTPYRWAGVATMYDGREITNESVRLANHFLELGVKQFPTDWELPFMLGCNYLFELKPRSDEERHAFRRVGAEYVRHAGIVGGGPPWIALLAATILRKEGEEEAALRHLEEVFYATQDDKVREEVRRRLLSLRTSIDLKRVEEDRRRFEAAWRAALPYAPPDLFVIMGPRRPRAFDLAALRREALLEGPEDAPEVGDPAEAP